MTSSGFLAIFVGFVVTTATTAQAQDVVSTCGTTVKNGVLTSDLDCSASLIGITLEPKGTLNLAGFTLTSGSTVGVTCQSSCTIDGSGGAIAGGPGAGVLGSDVSVSNVEIFGHARDAIRAEEVTVVNANIHDNAFFGVRGTKRKVEVTGSTISGNTQGITSRGSVRITSSTISDNEWGIHSERRVDLEGSSVTGSDEAGIWARKVRAANSAIENNGLDCAEHNACYDIGTNGRPRIDPMTVSCGLSSRLDPDTGHRVTGEDWDICTLD